MAQTLRQQAARSSLNATIRFTTKEDACTERKTLLAGGTALRGKGAGPEVCHMPRCILFVLISLRFGLCRCRCGCCCCCWCCHFSASCYFYACPHEKLSLFPGSSPLFRFSASRQSPAGHRAVQVVRSHFSDGVLDARVCCSCSATAIHWHAKVKLLCVD